MFDNDVITVKASIRSSKGHRSMMRRHSVRHRSIVSTAIVAAALLLSPALAHAAEPDAGGEPYRQNLHYSPAQNWVNDPNGMIYYKGTYHLFYQHNPSGDQWGNMSWGHATSPDLMRWTEQPLAIPYSEHEFIYSGSTVIDWNNTSGFGTAENPPMVAIYTSAYQNHPIYQNRQATSLAYSLDEGQTWTKYQGNPVDDRNRGDYRDPKVFWYGDEETGYWVAVTVEADASRVIITRSDDLKTWTELQCLHVAGARRVLGMPRPLPDRPRRRPVAAEVGARAQHAGRSPVVRRGRLRRHDVHR